MDGLSLLRRAAEAGLSVQVKGDRLVVTGPRAAEGLARLLLESKPQVLAVKAKIRRLAEILAEALQAGEEDQDADLPEVRRRARQMLHEMDGLRPHPNQGVWDSTTRLWRYGPRAGGAP